MESQCPLDGIQVSEATFHEVANLYEVEERPGLEVSFFLSVFLCAGTWEVFFFCLSLSLCTLVPYA